MSEIRVPITSPKGSPRKEPFGNSFLDREGALERPPPHPFLASWPQEPIVAGPQDLLVALIWVIHTS